MLSATGIQTNMDTLRGCDRKPKGQKPYRYRITKKGIEALQEYNKRAKNKLMLNLSDKKQNYQVWILCREELYSSSPGLYQFFQNHKQKKDCPEYPRGFPLCYVPGFQGFCKGLFHGIFQGLRARELLPDLTISHFFDAKIIGELIAPQSYQ
ncbi:hypothetical protein DU79_09675 [Methanosarcina mazei]|uniref:Uncharacterized protein n=1 Tax=Methanosarcina mazei TaxID=2209 RepID=A0A0F8U9Y7_METMZ|nr:hypothetical protein DU79_09675 [Methanosarcina mazei]